MTRVGGRRRHAAVHRLGARRPRTVQDFLVDLVAGAVAQAWEALQDAELAMMERDDEPTQLAYAHALADWGDAGGYDAEVLWDTVTVAALGIALRAVQVPRARRRCPAASRSGSRWSCCCAGRDEVLLLDEPDNYLDVPGKRWLEQRLRETPKTVLFVSHDRELLAGVADRDRHRRGRHDLGARRRFRHLPRGARSHRHERMAELRRRWDEEHARLKELVSTLKIQARISETMAQKYRVHGPPARALRGRRARRRTGPRTSRSRCGCAADAPACAPSPASASSSPA